MEFTTIIGLEVHVQLLTSSKLFCGCANRFNPDNPNVQTCPVCLGLPGALPVMNRHAFDLSVETAIALNCQIAEFTKWDRKQYYYPDLPKAYQISQYDLPFSHDGWLDVKVDEGSETVRIRIIRAHLEEDAGKNIHDASGRGGDSQVDLNRTGTPLLEIVSEPDLRSAAQARKYLEEMRLLLMYLNVSDCNMQEGSLRCDANVNLHVHNGDERIATPIVEIKNMNSFRNVEMAIDYEVERQVRLWNEKHERLADVPKRTRGWDANRGVTFAQREKEDVSDYRFIPDPDLVPITVGSSKIDAIKAAMCELPAARRSRFQSEFGLSHYDATVVTDQGSDLADYFESVATGCGDGKLAANWVTQDVMREINERKLAIGEFAIGAEVLSTILQRIANRKITTKSGREVFAKLLVEADAGHAMSADRVDAIIESEGLAPETDTGRIDAVIDQVIASNAAVADDIRGGKLQAVGPLIGQIMRELKGADPKNVREIILNKLK
jgi:aspartyl-tRNA(Asn)/glutamyl-tRNA(Gln) amidotransferase subunit B